MGREDIECTPEYVYSASSKEFLKITGGPIAYWASNSVRSAFDRLPSFGEVVRPKVGLQTGSNERFMRFWHEVSIDKIGFHLKSCEDASKTASKWFPYNKGGNWRKWYGNCDYVVDWENNGERIRNFKDDLGKLRSRPQNTSFYFKEGVTWADITTKSFAARYAPQGFIFDVKGSSGFPDRKNLEGVMGLVNSKLMDGFMKILNPTSTFQVGDMARVPFDPSLSENSLVKRNVSVLVKKSKQDWDSFESSWEFSALPLLSLSPAKSMLRERFEDLRSEWKALTLEVQDLEEENNSIFAAAYGLESELSPKVPLEEITLKCNPKYRYGANRDEKELQALQQCDAIREMVSYALGCMMGRFSLDKPGLILANHGGTVDDYLKQIASPSFLPDEDAILPLTNQEWFPDDVTKRFRDFIRAALGDEHLQENIDFVAESLCKHALKPQRGESALDTVRRYFSSQFYKDHLNTFSRRPIYWLFSSGKEKAFECLVYVHRLNDGSLARMRTEYVIPLSARFRAHVEKLKNDKSESNSASEVKRIEKEINSIQRQQVELAEFDEKLRNYADQRIRLDLDDGVKRNYGKFSGVLADVGLVTGDKGL